MQIIQTDSAPQPAGHYSQAVVANGMVYVSGQLAITPSGEKWVDESIAKQAQLIFKNIEAILKSAGSGLDNIVQNTIYISDIRLWNEVNVVYSQIFKNHKPARAIVPVPTLHYGLKLEIQTIAQIG